MKNNKIILKSISKSDYGFLYDLLEERNSQVNISHKTMPTYDEHLKFIKSKPYSKWYIIYFKNIKIGTISLTFENEVGIFITKNIQHEGAGSFALQLLIKKNPHLRYLANINPNNKKSIKFFKKNNFKLIQYTYEKVIADKN
jgi:RimJ/RimL family protein N-acetyltransferase|tara:strand:- start:2379 stop:2804 length:426 start_codon:yes stop_codon:yes gene_type:complete